MFSKLCRIGNQPEIRFTPGGDAVLNLSLAYNYGRKGEDGKRQTQWLEGSMWGKQAEAVHSYLHKGDQISASVDDLHIETYEGKNGTGTKLVGRIVSFDFVSGKRNIEEQEPIKAQDDSQPSAGTSTTKSGAFDNFDDDIPF
ncbi:Ssb Single-stranded DNA-binding protein [uncultured Caudovirales phage]|uniref:Single-stranded DNA-binding protein n=1 Tax=uncultured Caudovirales phage TaxID=2100421 RepID=A0A6J5QSZ4_9CAUD|nr:Ssb Single-stranded DNA-binding protein [uncultured Caudovirales phage]